MHALLFGPLFPVVWLIEFAGLIYLLKRQQFRTLPAVLWAFFTELGLIVFLIQWAIYASEGKTIFGKVKGASN